jgi:hypothetical protein
MIDCKSVDDYKILNAITDLETTKLEKVTICSHQHLWSFGHKITPKTHIYMFDADHWLNSYLYSLQQPIDLLHMTNLVDQLSYRYGLEGNAILKEVCENIVTQLCIFTARFHAHIGKYLTNTQVTNLDFVGLPDDTRDIYIRRLVSEIEAYISDYKTEL